MSWKSLIPCLVCGNDEAEIHHIYTRKAYPEYIDEEWNHLSLCRGHHSVMHQLGIDRMAEQYVVIKSFLKENNWYKCQLQRKWKHER